MITYVVLYPGDEATGAQFASRNPSIEEAADALALYHGFHDRDELLSRLSEPLIVGFAPLH